MQQRPRAYIGGALHPGKILDLHSHQYFIEWVVFLSRYQITMQTLLAKKIGTQGWILRLSIKMEILEMLLAVCNEITLGFLFLENSKCSLLWNHGSLLNSHLKYSRNVIGFQ